MFAPPTPFEPPEQLFRIIKSSARPINLGDPNRTGFGLPDAHRALPVFPARVPMATVDELLRQVTSLLSGAAPRPIVPFGSAPEASTGLPPTQHARDYLIDELKKRLKEANLW